MLIKYNCGFFNYKKVPRLLKSFVLYYILTCLYLVPFIGTPDNNIKLQALKKMQCSPDHDIVYRLTKWMFR